MPQDRTCKFNHQHVFLIGTKNDPVQLREFLATKMVKIHLHDSDEYSTSTDDEGRVFAKGLAQFTFRDFLRPFCRELKLRSDVFPCKRVNEDNTQNLDLNTSARKEERPQDKLNPYLSNATYCVIRAN